MGAHVSNKYYGGLGQAAAIQMIWGSALVVVGLLCIAGLWRRFSYVAQAIILVTGALSIWKYLLDPLGLYLLSFSLAFADRRQAARAITLVAPIVMVFAGSYAMLSTGINGVWGLLGPCVLLFCVATALHSRLYDLRPGTGNLTRFYFFMSLGGALGGLFTALIAPLVFDWVWEHPLLLLAAAMLAATLFPKLRKGREEVLKDD